MSDFSAPSPRQANAVFAGFAIFFLVVTLLIAGTQTSSDSWWARGLSVVGLLIAFPLVRTRHGLATHSTGWAARVACSSAWLMAAGALALLNERTGSWTPVFVAAWALLPLLWRANTPAR